jgi:hypothetical protein
MADKVITGLSLVSEVNLSDSLVLAQEEAEAKRCLVSDILGASGSTTASNIGGGTGLFSAKVDTNLNFKSIAPSGTVFITESSDNQTITISGSGVNTGDFVTNGMTGNFVDATTTGYLINLHPKTYLNITGTGTGALTGEDGSLYVNFLYADSGHFPSGIEVDAPTSEGACDISTQSRQNAAIWPSSDRAYNIGAYSQAFDHGYAVQWNDLSDKNTKKEIKDTNLGLNFITGLKPRSFKFKDHLSSRGDLIKHNRTRHGLVAQEVKDTLDSIGVSTSGFAGYIDSSHQYPDQETSYWLHYSQFISPLIKSVQELHAMVTGLQNQIDNA